MADLFLHLAFARRLRLAEGLHPLIGETLTRRPALVVLGAALPHLPGVERKGMGFFQRLFSRGSEAARWEKQLAATSSPRAELVKRFFLPANDLGPLARCSVALGVLAHELLAASTSSLAPSTADRAGVERAQARLWLQAAIPSARELEHEWRPIADLADAGLHKRAIEHVDGALKTAFGQGPGREGIARWMKGLVAEVAPAALGGLPPTLGVADHVARGPHFENNNFVARVQDAVTWFVIVANRLGERVERADVNAVAVIDALCAGGAEILQADAAAGARRERWESWQRERRATTLDRGRNEKPAFCAGADHHRGNAFTGMLNLSDLPPSDLPPELHVSSLPPESTAAAPPLPAMTKEISLAAIAAAAGGARFQTPARTQEISLVQVEAESRAFGAPAATQELSLAQVEAESRAFGAPAATQELSLAQIEAESRAFGAPAATQELSLAQIEAAADLRSAVVGEFGPPPAPLPVPPPDVASPAPTADAKSPEPPRE